MISPKYNQVKLSDGILWIHRRHKTTLDSVNNTFRNRSHEKWWVKFDSALPNICDF